MTRDRASRIERPAAGYEIPPFGGMKPGPRASVRQESERLGGLRFRRIGVRRLGTTLGAEIEGVDLGALDDEIFAEVHRAWLEFKVVFFRDQQIDAEQQVAFARRFGALEEHPFLDANEDHAEVVRFEKGPELSGFENLWHSDVSWREVPALGSVLRAIEVPRVGGDTLFCDMITAYAGLDDEIRERIDSLFAVHDFTHSFGRLLDAATLAERKKEYPAVRHPVVRTHPETGRKILYVNPIFVSHLDGVDPEASARLLDLLYRQATVPEYQVRFQWQAASVAFWDNRSVQHYAASDYWPARRTMERVAIVGDRPR